MLDVSHRRHFAEDGLPQRCRFTCRGSIWLTSAKVFAGQNHAQLTNLATHIRAPSQKKFGVNPGGLLNVNSFPDLGVYPCRLCQFPKGGPKPKFAFIFSKCASPAMPGAERQLNCPENSGWRGADDGQEMAGRSRGPSGHCANKPRNGTVAVSPSLIGLSFLTCGLVPIADRKTNSHALTRLFAAALCRAGTGVLHLSVPPQTSKL